MDATTHMSKQISSGLDGFGVRFFGGSGVHSPPMKLQSHPKPPTLSLT